MSELNGSDDGKPNRDRHTGFAEAYLDYGGPNHGYVLKMVGNEADAEDLTVLAFEKALRAWDRRPVDEGFRPWLYRIATNVCLDELRRRRLLEWRPWDSFASVFHPSQVAPDNPEQETLRKEKAELVRAALARLSDRDRAALVMRECNGMPMEEVSAALGLSRDALKVALFRARERLRAAYLQLGGEIPATASTRVVTLQKGGGVSMPASGQPVVSDPR